jgi:hypothetical protein
MATPPKTVIVIIIIPMVDDDAHDRVRIDDHARDRVRFDDDAHHDWLGGRAGGGKRRSRDRDGSQGQD